MNKDEMTENDLNIVDKILSEVEEISVNKAIQDFGVDEKNLDEWLRANAFRIFRTASSTSVRKLVDEKKKQISNEFVSVLSSKEKKLYVAKTNYSDDSKSPRVQVLFADEYLEYTLGDFWNDISTTGLEFEGNIDFKNGKKPLKLIDRLLNTIQDKDFVVMDFFGGSGTTAEAVMKKNINDNGSRKFIIIQLPEDLDVSYEKATGELKKTIKSTISFLDEIGKPHKLSEIGKERIRRAGEKIKEEYKGKEGLENLDVGFKVFQVADTNIRWTNEALKNGQITIEESSMSDKDKIDFMPHTTDLDVVYEVMIRQRDIPLSSKVEKLSEIGDRTYIFANSYLVCLEEKVTEELVEKLAAIEPLPFKFIFRDSAFEDNISLKDETFRRLQILIERNTGESKKTYTVEFL